MRARKLFALGIAAIAAFAALCLLGEGDLATVRSAGVEVPAASNDPKPAAPADAATAADAQRTELPPAADGAVAHPGRRSARRIARRIVNLTPDLGCK